MTDYRTVKYQAYHTQITLPITQKEGKQHCIRAGYLIFCPKMADYCSTTVNLVTTVVSIKTTAYIRYCQLWSQV